MPSTYSSNLKIELMSTGENSGTWGNITNANLGTALEQAVVGYGNVDYLADANLTISISNSNSAQAARALVLNVTSSLSLTGTRELVVPTIEKQYIVQNNTTGSQSITVKTSAGTGITVPNGRKAHLYVDGTNVIQMFDFVDINGGTIDGTPIGGSSAAAGAFTTLNASGATTLDGNVTLGNAAGDNITFTGTITSHLLFTDNTYDIGASGATRPRNLFLAGNATVGGNLSVGGTLTLTGGVNLNGNVTVGDNASDTLTINATITSNLIFTDNTYDIGASGATRPRNLFLAGNATIGGNQTLTGSLTVDSTTDSSSTTTGSIQTDGGLGVAKALYVGTTANIAGAVTLGGGTANGVAYLDGSKVLTTGGALTFDGTNLLQVNAAAGKLRLGVNTSDQFLDIYRDSGSGASVYNAAQGSGFGFHVWQVTGSEQMRLTSTGLGIGTSSPTSSLTVGNAGATWNTFYANSSAKAVITSGDGVANNMFVRFIGGVYGQANTTSLDLIHAGKDNNIADGWRVLAGCGTSSVTNNSYYSISSIASNGSGLAATERMRLDSSGNLGLGVTPSAWGSIFKAQQFGNYGAYVAGRSDSQNQIQIGVNNYFNGTNFVYTNTDNASRYVQINGQHQWYNAPSGTAGNAISFTQAMTLDASGRLLVATTSSTGANAKLVVGAGLTSTNAVAVINTANANIDALSISNWDGSATSYGPRIVFDNSGRGAFIVGCSDGANNFDICQTWGTPQVRITSGGDLLVGTTSTILASKIASVAGASQNGGAFQTTASANNYTAIAGARNGNTGNVAEWWYDLSTQVGTISVTSTATAYNTSSDYRLKDNQQPLTGSGAFIDALQPKTWDWKAGGSKGVGFIAHEVQAVSPGSVVGEKDAVDADGKPVMQAMEYGSAEFIANIIAELQSLRARVAALEAS